MPKNFICALAVVMKSVIPSGEGVPAGVESAPWHGDLLAATWGRAAGCVGLEIVG